MHVFARYRLAALFVAALVLVGCGQRVRGTYSGAGRGFFDHLTFQSGGKVEISFMSMTKEATYEVDGNKVKVTHGGDTQVFTIEDNGCLNGGQLLGSYCRDGGEGNSVLSGVYKAGQGSDGIALSFLDAKRVLVRISERGRAGDSAEGTYRVNGKQVTVNVPGGQPLVLDRHGDTLEGSMEGTRLRFIKH
jgi:hypothetical protein